MEFFTIVLSQSFAFFEDQILEINDVFEEERLPAKTKSVIFSRTPDS